MKILSFVVSFILTSICVIAQPTSFLVNGKVLDAATSLPLQAASVFAQNTTMGTATSAEGNFVLRLPNGGYDLVVTFTGYETITRRISTADTSNNNIVIELKQKEKAMEEISIKTSNEVKDGLEKYGDFFTENFIGKTTNSSQCVIKNKEALKFYFSKKRNRLKVLCAEPILIENLALGYTIKYTLDSFTHDYTSLVSSYTGYPLFEAIATADLTQASTWRANRLKAYNGSILHFMRSAYQKNLQKEGFEVQFLFKNNDTETAIPVKNLYGGLNYSKDDSTQVVEIQPNQPDVAVLYKNELPDKEYIAQNQEAAAKKFQLSIITIPALQAIGIEQNGYYFDQNDITITGYWSWEKVGDMLPYDYKAE
jgi:hypothetical protein